MSTISNRFGPCALALGLVATPALAADLPAPVDASVPLTSFAPSYAPFFVHLGVAGLVFDEGAKIKAGGATIPGATIKISPPVTAEVEAGYRVTPNFAVAVALGAPPTSVIEGAGSIAGYGKLGSVVYGPAAVLAQYHFTNFGAIQPYLGVGPTYMFVFNERDGALSNLRIDPAWGVVGQVGADVMISDRWGVFIDVKKAYLRTQAKGQLGPVPLTAAVRLDPLVLSGGVTYRF